MFHQLAIPTTIEQVCPFKCSKPLGTGDWVLKKNYFNLNSQCQIAHAQSFNILLHVK